MFTPAPTCIILTSFQCKEDLPSFSGPSRKSLHSRLLFHTFTPAECCKVHLKAPTVKLAAGAAAAS